MLAHLMAFGSLVVFCVAAAGCQKATNPNPVTARTPEEVRDAFLKAADEKNFAVLDFLSDTPWFDTNRQLIRDKKDLPAALKRAATQLPQGGKRKFEMVEFKGVREKIDNEADRKLFGELLGDDGWLVAIEDESNPHFERMLLIRVKDGVAKVVGGPLKPNQVTPTNVIPEVVQKLLDKSETFELYSLDPTNPGLRKDKEAPAFHDYGILGKIEVKTAEDRKKLVDALHQGAEDNSGTVAGCFIPRHGIRLKAGDDTVDLVICFQCMSVNVYHNDKQLKQFLTTSEPSKTFNAVLKAANIKLPQQADE